MSKKAGYYMLPLVPNTVMKRALLKSRGLDPDAQYDALNFLDKIDVMTMNTYLAAYTAMAQAYVEEDKALKKANKTKLGGKKNV